MTDSAGLTATGVRRLGEALADARAGVAFTGAGISTESGIPDFRSRDGLWSRYRPRDFSFSRYVASPQVRAEAWRRRRELWSRPPRPNPGHLALAGLERAGRLAGVVTQNVDGLHQAAGSRRVVELHGSSRFVMCIGARPRAGTPAGCGFHAGQDWALARHDAGEADPGCPDCGGLVKSTAVSFGQNLFPGVLYEATRLVRSADLVVAIGSTLRVQPAAGLPAAAARAGVPLAIVNDEPTPLDDVADLVVRGRAGRVLPAATDVALALA
ncbi:MAG: Sir2 family NAD-dependent protein deacetylase [Actinomycetota bacterium]|nr:Sir2 family NAD-dependent protein deacetylase [Actinomycetota bacterium]